MSDSTYGPKIYHKQGGDVMVVAAGGQIDVEQGTATSTAAAAEANTQSGIITTEALTTAAGADYTFTLTNSLITALSNLMVLPLFGTATAGQPSVVSITPAAGSAVIVVRNHAPAAAINGTLKLQFALV